MRRLFSLAALAAVALLSTAAVATGTPPKSATLTFDMQVTGAGVASGTWSATSALAALNGKSGTVTQTFRIAGKAKGQKARRVVHGHKTVTTTAGNTFHIYFRGPMKMTGATTAVVNGRFVLKKGTGEFKGLKGTGKISATLDFQTGDLDATYTGKVHQHG